MKSIKKFIIFLTLCSSYIISMEQSLSHQPTFQVPKIESELSDKFEQDDCPICLSTFENPVTLNCHKKHTFCRDCIRQWDDINNTCPICKKEINTALIKTKKERLISFFKRGMHPNNLQTTLISSSAGLIAGLTLPVVALENNREKIFFSAVCLLYLIYNRNSIKLKKFIITLLIGLGLTSLLYLSYSME